MPSAEDITARLIGLRFRKSMLAKRMTPIPDRYDL
jgi:hypothetical protein